MFENTVLSKIIFITVLNCQAQILGFYRGIEDLLGFPPPPKKILSYVTGSLELTLHLTTLQFWIDKFHPTNIFSTENWLLFHLNNLKSDTHQTHTTNNLYDHSIFLVKKSLRGPVGGINITNPWRCNMFTHIYKNKLQGILVGMELRYI